MPMRKPRAKGRPKPKLNRNVLLQVAVFEVVRRPPFAEVVIVPLRSKVAALRLQGPVWGTITPLVLKDDQTSQHFIFDLSICEFFIFEVFIFGVSDSRSVYG